MLPGRGWWSAVRIALLLLLPLAAPLGAQPPASHLEQGIFELRLMGFDPATALVVVDSSGSVLVPLSQVLTLTGTPFERLADGTLRIDRGPAGGVVTLHAASGRLRQGGQARELGAGALRRLEDGDLAIATDALAELLNARVELNWAALRIDLSRTPPFPVQHQLSARRRREVLAARERFAARARPPAGVPLRASSGGLALDWGITTDPQDPSRQSAFSLNSGFALLGGGLNVGGVASVQRAGELELRRTGLHYVRLFPENRWLGQLQLGEMLPAAGLSRPYRGVLLSNAPYIQPSTFGSVELQPSLPPGWEYEVYQGGQLIGFSNPADAGAVALELRYGATPVEIRLLGPAGEERTVQLAYRTPTTMIGPGRWEYGIGGGRCLADACRGYGFLQLRRGWSPRLTTVVGAEAIHDSVATTWRPLLQASYASGTRMTAELVVVADAYLRLSSQWFPAERTIASLSLGVAEPGRGDIRWRDDAGRDWDASIWLDQRTDGSVRWLRSLRLETRVLGSGSETHRAYLSAAAYLPRSTQMELAYELDTPLDDDYVRVRGYAPLALLSPALPRTALLSLGGGIDPDGPRFGEVGLTGQLDRRTTLNLSLQWFSGQRSSLHLGFFRRMGFGQLFGRAATAAGGRPSTSLSLSGGAALRPGLEIVAVPDHRVGWAGVNGRVFYDVDGDGHLDADEAGAAGVALYVAGQRVVTDSGGSYHHWGINPFVVQTIHLDSLSIPDPGWTTTRPAFFLRGAPNVFTRLDVPLVRTRELVGRLVAGAGIATVAGVTLEISAVDVDQQAATRATTFSDGEFYVSRMRPGRYRLVVAPSSLAALRARSSPDTLVFDVPAEGDDPLVELPPLLLERREPMHAPPAAVHEPAVPALQPSPRSVLLGSVHFATGSAALRARARATLEALAGELQRLPDIAVLVVGHTDSTGTLRTNRRLAEARARQVSEFLVAHGVPAARLTVAGRASTEPVASNRTAAGRTRNRRAEVHRLVRPEQTAPLTLLSRTALPPDSATRASTAAAPR